MVDSIGKDQKSEYSYLQYHWCAIIFKDSLASIDSSNIYNNNREGIAICTNTSAGIIVQIHSITCLSNKFLVTILFKTV